MISLLPAYNQQLSAHNQGVSVGGACEFTTFGAPKVTLKRVSPCFNDRVYSGFCTFLACVSSVVIYLSRSAFLAGWDFFYRNLNMDFPEKGRDLLKTVNQDRRLPQIGRPSHFSIAHMGNGQQITTQQGAAHVQ